MPRESLLTETESCRPAILRVTGAAESGVTCCAITDAEAIADTNKSTSKLKRI
jgi:hypothetical protein